MKKKLVLYYSISSLNNVNIDVSGKIESWAKLNDSF